MFSFAMVMPSMKASTITFDFTAAGTNVGSGFGNVRTFTTGGVTVTVTAWGLTGSGSTFQTAQLGKFSTGLGSCNQTEGTGCSNPSHQFDNGGEYEFALFQFSTAVDPLTITINPYGAFDRDVTYFVGNTASGLNLGGLTLGGLAGLGFGSAINNDSTISDNARAVSLVSNQVNSVLFGARLNGDSDIDRFKIAGMTVEKMDGIPEPATFGLIGLGLITAGAVRLRKERNRAKG